MEIVGQIISALGIIIAAVIAIKGYSWQKSSELEKSHTELRREAYRKFLRQLPQVATSAPEALLEYNSIVAELNLVASDFVLVCVGEFNQYMKNTSPQQRSPETYKKLIAKIAINMRKDCFNKTELELDTVAQTLPFS